MRKQEEPYLTGNLTAMIDVVFQLIIFFVCTVSMQERSIDDSIRLSMAPHGVAKVIKNPLEITVDVDRYGHIKLNHMRYTRDEVGYILKKATDASGADNVPVIIRGDEKTKHEAIKDAMDACSKAGIIKIRFAAMKERAS